MRIQYGELTEFLSEDKFGNSQVNSYHSREISSRPHRFIMIRNLPRTSLLHLKILHRLSSILLYHIQLLCNLETQRWRKFLRYIVPSVPLLLRLQTCILQRQLHLLIISFWDTFTLSSLIFCIRILKSFSRLRLQLNELIPVVIRLGHSEAFIL